jgi:hypothetical protein
MEAHRLNVPVTAENLDANKAEFDEQFRRLAEQDGQTVQAGPEEMTVAGKPRPLVPSDWTRRRDTDAPR